MPVLVDESITEELRDAVDRLGATFEAPSGRTYLLERSGSQLTVSVALAADLRLPPDSDVDADLLELARALYDHLGGEWSGDLLRNVVKTWAPATDDSKG
jgi:hypothetical protein